MAKKNGRKGGRKANQWTLMTFADIAVYLGKAGMSQTDFAKSVGVTSSTFHNWKTNRCAPDEATQGKIAAVITGKEVSVPKKKKIKKVTARGSRGAGSSTLAALSGAEPAKVAKAKKKTKKVAKKKIEKKRLGPTPRKPRIAASYNGNGNSLEGWNNLKALAKFLKANSRRSPDEVKGVVEQVNAARQLAEIFA